MANCNLCKFYQPYHPLGTKDYAYCGICNKLGMAVTGECPCSKFENKFNENMNKPEDIKIECPEGYTYELVDNVIKFKKKEKTWEEIKKWAEDNMPCCVNNLLKEGWRGTLCQHAVEHNHMYAYSKLYCIAEYLNKEWKAKNGQDKWHIFKNAANDDTYFAWCSRLEVDGSTIYFKSKEDGEEAIKIMGDDIKFLF